MSLRSLLSLSAAFAALVVCAACPTNVKPPTGNKGCDDATGCGSGQVCQEGTCVAPCTNGGCSQGVCDLGTGLCVECVTTADCSDGRVCNEFSGRCVDEIPGCGSDADCQGLLCDLEKGTCVQCRNDSDCGLGATCDLGSQVCVVATACGDDGDCAPGLVCDPDGGTCVVCYDDDQCPGGVCDLQTHSCPAVCNDTDATEPNEGADAVAISAGGSHEGQICGGDTDELLITAEGTLTALLSIDGGAELSMVLENSSGSLVATATSTATGLSLTAGNLTVGTYRIVITGARVSDEGAYLLSVDVDTPVVCADVDAEPNDANAQAVDLPTTGALRSGNICSPDTDVWTFDAAQGDDVVVTVTAGAGGGVLNVVVQNGAGTTLGTGLTVNLNDVAAGAYFVRVTANAEVAYTLRATASAAPPVCMQTDAEPNDLDAQALLLTPATPSSGTICANDTDQHRFAATGLDDVTVTVIGAGITASLVRAADGATIGNGATITVANLQAGGYRVVVRGATAQTEGSYSVNVVLTAEPVPDPCEEGGIEPDDSAARALPLDSTPLAGRICAGDTDFFDIDVPFDTTLTVTARFTHASGDLDMRLVDGAGAFLTSAVSVTNDEIIVRALTPGSYQIQVYGYAGALNTYTMEASLQGCTPEDAFEDNSAPARATPVGPQALSGARCPGDDDYFLLRLENGDALDATLAPTGGALTMSLVSTTGTLLQSDAPNGANRRLQTSGLAAGSYLVRVTGTGAERVSYTLTPAITPTPARCVDDGASPNETSAAAFSLDDSGLLDGSYQLGTLVTCAAGDQDWFAIDLPAERHVALQLAFPTADDVDIELLEPRGTSGFTRSLHRSYAVDVQDRVEGNINAAGRYLIKTVGYRSTAIAYGVGVELSALPNVPCNDDRYDSFTATVSGSGTTPKNNDVAADAVVVSLGEVFTAQQACTGDADWYKLALTQGDPISVSVDYTHQSGGDIDVRLYGPANQTTVLTTCTTQSNVTGTNLSCISAGVDGSEDLITTAATTGDHFIEVYGFSQGQGAYTLTVE